MDRKALLDHLNFLNADTSAFNDNAVAGYRYALRRVADYIKSQPIDKEDAAKILSDYVEFMDDDNSNPNDSPYTFEEVRDAMKMGAEALMKQ